MHGSLAVPTSWAAERAEAALAVLTIVGWRIGRINLWGAWGEVQLHDGKLWEEKAGLPKETWEAVSTFSPQTVPPAHDLAGKSAERWALAEGMQKRKTHKGWVPGRSWRQEEQVTGTAENQRSHKEGQAKDSWRKMRASQREHERAGDGAVDCVDKTSSSEQKLGIGGLLWETERKKCQLPIIQWLLLIYAGRCSRCFHALSISIYNSLQDSIMTPILQMRKTKTQWG